MKKDATEELLRIFEGVPSDAQKKIRDCWERWSGGRPVVETMDKSALSRLGIRWAGTDGARFYFRDKLFSEDLVVPTAVLDAILAHELAHSFHALDEFFARLANGIRITVSRIGPPTLISEAIEKANNYIYFQTQRDFSEGKAWLKARQWGFDQDEALKWLEANLP